MLESFIEQKSTQLAFYVSKFLRGQVDPKELHLFIWDTLEEWATLKVRNKTPSTFREHVFWYTIHQLEFWPESKLRQDQELRQCFQSCLAFLLGKSKSPTHLVGVRP